MPAPRNLVNLNAVEKSYGSRAVLHDITLGISSAERIGLVGQNGGGKSTLLRLIAGIEQPDAGALTRAGDVGVALLGQRDELDEQRTIRELLVGERAEHEWAGDSAFRNVLDGLLGGVELRLFASGMETPIAGLSGGERRRIALARLLLDPPELLLLDEPTNHLDVEGVDWLAHHLAARRRLDARRHARPLVPRRRLHGHVGARRRRGAPVRRRLRGVRARARRARTPGGLRARAAAGSCCARSSPGCAAARRRARASRSSASTRPTR